MYGTFNSVDEYSLDLFPFDSDVLSMEIDSSFKVRYVSTYSIIIMTSMNDYNLLQDCQLQGDMTTMFHAAKSLMTLQALYGVIPNIYGKGKLAKARELSFFSLPSPNNLSMAAILFSFFAYCSKYTT